MRSLIRLIRSNRLIRLIRLIKLIRLIRLIGLDLQWRGCLHSYMWMYGLDGLDGIDGIGIPDNCHFFYNDTIFGAENLHPNTRIYQDTFV